MLMSEEITRDKAIRELVQKRLFGGNNTFFSLNASTPISIAAANDPIMMTNVLTKSRETYFDGQKARGAKKAAARNM